MCFRLSLTGKVNCEIYEKGKNDLDQATINHFLVNSRVGSYYPKRQVHIEQSYFTQQLRRQGGSVMHVNFTTLFWINGFCWDCQVLILIKELRKSRLSRFLRKYCPQSRYFLLVTYFLLVKQPCYEYLFSVLSSTPKYDSLWYFDFQIILFLQEVVCLQIINLLWGQICSLKHTWFTQKARWSPLYPSQILCYAKLHKRVRLLARCKPLLLERIAHL